MAGIDYRTPKATWTQKANGQWRVQIRVKVPTDTDAEGRTTYTPKRLSKQFSPDESAKLTTENKRRTALNKWIDSLEQADADAEDARRKAAEDAERREQEDARRKEQAEREAIEAAKPKNKTVPEYVTSYVETLEASGSIERHTARDYRTIARRIEAAFAGVKMCELTTAQVQKWENRMVAEGLAPSTVIKHHRVIAAVFKHAVAVRDLDWNPCDAVKVPKKGKPSPNSLTVEGYARLAATLAALEATQVVTAAAIALFTGAREGEVCGMTWADYDATAQTLRVSRAIGKDGGKTYVKQAKNDSSQNRIMPVNDVLADMLDRRRAYMVAELEGNGIALDDSEFARLYIVGYWDGRFLSPLWLCRAWRELSAAFGLIGTQGRAITYHDLRHSFASVTIASGADVRAVAAVLGHANPSITLGTYADALPSAKRAVADLLQAVAGAKAEPYAELAE
jgi:integrase